jgi:threonine/homoserine/homoserine lactone efflux protein
MWSLASTPGNLLVIPRNSNTGGIRTSLVFALALIVTDFVLVVLVAGGAKISDSGTA